jgi:hypothetical protein
LRIFAQPVGPARLFRPWRTNPRRHRTQKHGKSHFGDKPSIGADKRHKLIRKLKIGAPRENDTRHPEDVPIPPTPAAIPWRQELRRW